ncbi:uncharacterized protein LOC123269628 [Cotesia glomerata]|uniref:uncharacterized protein LOC123269628 n=1 Tax=Cotesia glomerata TaxID=32391 RepID=UPI001D02989C|nr:uncharacterized protein LOC123269628 [Cotesia glomerata]
MHYNNFSFSETYDIARAVEIAAVDSSTSDEAAMSRLQDGQTLGTKRERKRPGRFLDQESDRASSSDDYSRDMQNDKETTPKHQFHYDSGHDSSKDVEETQELDYSDFFENHPQHSTKPKSKNINVRKIENITHTIIKSKTSQSIDKTKEPVVFTEMAKDPGTLTPVDETIDKTIEINIENGIHHQSPSQGAISKSPEPSLPMNDTETLTAEILKLDCSPNCCN